MALGEKAGRSRRRACSWNEGSEVMGGAKPTGAGVKGLKSDTMTLWDVKWVVSWAMAATSSWRVGSHPPPKRSVWATGHRPRRSSQISGAAAA